MEKALPRDEKAQSPSVTDSNYHFKKTSATLPNKQSGRLKVPAFGKFPGWQLTWEKWLCMLIRGVDCHPERGEDSLGESKPAGAASEPQTPEC